eukprot:2741284-Alexandrium_andersonii.AAC.1
MKRGQREADVFFPGFGTLLRPGCSVRRPLQCSPMELDRSSAVAMRCDAMDTGTFLLPIILWPSSIPTL